MVAAFEQGNVAHADACAVSKFFLRHAFGLPLLPQHCGERFKKCVVGSGHAGSRNLTFSCLYEVFYEI